MKYAFAFGLAGLVAAVPQSLGNEGSSTTLATDSTTPSLPWTTPMIPSISITDSSWDTATDSGWDTATSTDSSWDQTTSDYGWESSSQTTTTKTPCGGGSSPSTTDEWGSYSTPATSIPDVETSTSDWYSYSQPESSTAWSNMTDTTSYPDAETSTPAWSTDTPSVVTVTAPCTCCTDATTSAYDTWSGYTTTPVTESQWSTYSNFTMTTHAPIPTSLPAISTFTGAAMPTAMPQVFGAGVALVAAALVL